MYSVIKYQPKLYISLENGMYAITKSTSEDTTKLSDLLRKFTSYGESVISYTYFDYIRGESLQDFLNNKEYSVVMLDRYDLYYFEFIDTILELSRNSVVLIDTRRTEDVKKCVVRISKEAIDVIGLDEDSL